MKNKKLIVLLISIIIILIFCSICIISIIFINKRSTNKKNSADQKYSDTSEEPYADIKDLNLKTIKTSIDDDPVLGDKNKAKIAIIEFGNYDCIGCNTQAKYNLPLLYKNYIDNGEVIYIFRDNVYGIFNVDMPLAAECVHKISGDKTYYKYHDLIVENQDFSTSMYATLSKEKLFELAAKLNINQNEFRECFEKREVQEELDKDRQDAAKLQIGISPTTIIGVLDKEGNVYGFITTGVQSYPTYKSLIDALSKDSKSIVEEINKVENEKQKELDDFSKKLNSKKFTKTGFTPKNKEGGFILNKKVKLLGNLKAGDKLVESFEYDYGAKDYIDLEFTIIDFIFDESNCTVKELEKNPENESSAYDWVIFSQNLEQYLKLDNALPLEITIPRDVKNNKTYWFAVKIDRVKTNPDTHTTIALETEYIGYYLTIGSQPTPNCLKELTSK